MKGTLKMENTQKEIYRHYIALDWSQETVALASMRDSSTEVDLIEMIPEIKILKQYLKSRPGKKILTMEETTTSHWLYVELKDSVDKILVCDAYRNSLLKDGPKTDKLDARNLCLLLRSGLLKEVYHSLDKIYEIRKLVSAYEDFVNSSVRTKNQRSAIFRAGGKDHKKERLLSDSKITKFITEKQNLTIEHFDQTRKEFELMFSKIQKENKVISQLQKISGIGLIISVVIYATVIDAERFINKYKYWAYSGLAKHQKDSGGRSYGKKRIRHNKLLKKYYKIATKAALKGNNDIRQYYEYLLQNKYSFEQAQNQITRYLAKVSYAVMKNNTDYRAYQWKESKQKKTRVKR